MESNGNGEGFSATATGDDVCGKRGERPCISMSARIGLALRSYKHSLWRAARGDFSEPWCTSIPAHTGGDNGRLVAVDGEMRDPACFGGLGEPWAQLGDQDCGDTADVLERVVDTYAARNLLQVRRPLVCAAG